MSASGIDMADSGRSQQQPVVDAVPAGIDVQAADALPVKIDAPTIAATATQVSRKC